MNDVAARLDELRLLKDGWLDGKGLAPAGDGLDWLRECWQSLYPDDLPAPFLYPTAEGGVQAEWSVNGHEISLEVSLSEHRGQWHDLNVDTQRINDREVNLDDPNDWQWIADQICHREGVGR